MCNSIFPLHFNISSYFIHKNNRIFIFFRVTRFLLTSQLPAHGLHSFDFLRNALTWAVIAYTKNS